MIFPTSEDNDVTLLTQDGGFFSFKQVGVYKIEFQTSVTSYNLQLKDSNNTHVIRQSHGNPLEAAHIYVIHKTIGDWYMLNLSCDKETTLYRDSRYTWLSISYLGNIFYGFGN